MASDAGYHQALLVGSILMAAAALLALRIGNTRNPAPLVMVSTEVTPEPGAAGSVTANPDPVRYHRK